METNKPPPVRVFTGTGSGTDIIDVKEVARMLSVHPRTAWRLLRTGQIKGIQIQVTGNRGGVWRTYRHSVWAYIAGRQNGTGRNTVLPTDLPGLAAHA